MQLSLIHRERIRAIDPALEDVFDDLISTISATFMAEHDAQGRHTNVSLQSVTVQQTNPQNTTPSAAQPLIVAGQDGLWLKKGPFLIDDPTATNPNIAGLVPPKLATGTFDNYEPAGIDDCFLLELEPDGGAATLTGIKARAGGSFKRMMIIRNRDTAQNLILKHANTGSQAPNRFDLPSSTDITLGPGQAAWMYSDPNRGAWTLIITSMVAGGAGAIVSQDAVLFVDITLTDAQVKGLGTTPVTVVSAVAGKIIYPIAWFIIKDAAAGAWVGANRNFNLQWAALATDLMNAITVTLTAADKTYQNNNSAGGLNTTTVVSNSNLRVVTTGDSTGGNAANTIKIGVAYYLVDD